MRSSSSHLVHKHRTQVAPHSSRDAEVGEPAPAPDGGGGSASKNYKRKASGPDLFGMGLPPYGSGDNEDAAALCDTGNTDPELCDYDYAGPAAAETSAPLEAWTRGKWLLGLLVLQSTSSFVLESYEALLREHLVITLFLTMLVGAGGNAGNQSAIKVIRGMATGGIKPTLPYFQRVMAQQGAVALLLGGGLAVGGFLRVYVTNGDLVNSVAISLSLLTIVVTSVLAGAALPFALSRAGVDPANAGTAIQVIMDIMGVLITCTTCKLIFDQLALGVAS